MNLIIERFADPYVIVTILFLIRPILLILFLFAMFNIRKNRTRYFPLEKNDVYFVGSLFAVTFVLANLLLSHVFGKGDFINALLVSRPAVNYGTTLIAYISLLVSIIYLFRKRDIDLRRLMNVRIKSSIFYVFPSLLILVLLGAKAFSSVSGIPVFVFSEKQSNVSYIELVSRIICYLVLIPTAEELYLRGVVYNALQNYYKKHWAAILVSCYFAVGHLSYFASLMLWFLVMGLIYIGLYEKYKSLLPGIVLHGLMNIPMVLR